MKNKFILGFATALLLVSLVGCTGLLGQNGGVFGKTAKKEAAAALRIDTKNDEIKKTDEQRLTSIGAWSEGVGYSLNKSTNSEPAVTVAKDINDRVKALANKPNLDELKEVMGIIDTLLTNQISGQIMLVEKDKEIIKLQTRVQDLQDQKEDAINKYRNISEVNARTADQYKATLSDMDSFWGFGAITYGIKKLFTKLLLTLAIGTVIFIALRILAQTSPIAASIFMIFEQVGSWFINMLRGIFPKAASISGLVPQEDYQGYKNTLHKIVDAIETVKSKEKILKKTDPNDHISMDELETEIAKSFNGDDSDRVNQAQKSLLWKI